MEKATGPIVIEPWDRHNQGLVQNVHPPAWVNPTPSGRYNLVVIGAGTAGLVTAAGAAGLGAKVALIERELMGGDCLNVGCVPPKALLRAARAYADVRDAGELGVEVPSGTRVNFPAVIERMRGLRAKLSQTDSARRFRELGVDVFLGAGRFVSADEVEVNGARLSFKRAVIATGARAATPPIPGLAEAGFLTNETVFRLTELPRRLAVIGAGPIGCELSQAFARFGAQVTLLLMPQILPHADRAAAAVLQASLARDGIHILLGRKIQRVESAGGEKLLHVEAGGTGETLCADEILVGVGRAPNIEGLGLETVGVLHDAQGIKVDDRLRTTNRRIFAAGDVCPGYKGRRALRREIRQPATGLPHGRRPHERPHRILRPIWKDPKVHWNLNQP